MIPHSGTKRPEVPGEPTHAGSQVQHHRAVPTLQPQRHRGFPYLCELFAFSLLLLTEPDVRPPVVKNNRS